MKMKQSLWKCEICNSFTPTICGWCKEYVNMVFVNCIDNKKLKEEMDSHFIGLVKFNYKYDGNDSASIEVTMKQLKLLASYLNELKKNRDDGLFIFEDYKVEII